jgi:taurine dioxygenase
MSRAAVEVRKLTPYCGAMIAGVDLSVPLDDASFAAVHDALVDHGVIFFREQKLDIPQHKAFTRRFGEIFIHPNYNGVSADPEIVDVKREPGDKHIVGEDWHTDTTCMAEPPCGAVLYGVDVPPHGGDTMFANQYLAYETLSPGMKHLLGGLTAVHSARHIYGVGADNDYARTDGLGAMKILRSEAAHRETEHPVVRTHPETGRKCLYVNRNFTIRFKDMTVEESRPLLQFLFEHAVRPEYTCRFRWEAGSIAFWDNRCVQHYALNDYDGYRRVMHRVTINGDRPF